MKPFELLTFRNPHALAQTAATAWLEEVEKSNRLGKHQCVALSGGRITEVFFSAIAELAGRRAVSFHSTHFFWADERCVPPTDPQSNYRLAKATLFEPLQIAGANIHRVRGEDPPMVAARSAAEELCRWATSDQNGQPVLDMVFLGLGEDGHVASLFPGDWANPQGNPPTFRAITNSPKPPSNRITLDYQAIAAARKVWMLAAGDGKVQALTDSLSPSGTTPFARVLHSRRDTRIYTDIFVT